LFSMAILSSLISYTFELVPQIYLKTKSLLRKEVPPFQWSMQ
jgi:hypothetical protein